MIEAKAFKGPLGNLWSYYITGYNDGFIHTSPVDAFTPNPLGLYDMAGNVLQRCLDPSNEADKDVSRGATWNTSNFQSSNRTSTFIEVGRSANGFRCVLASSAPAPLNPANAATTPAAVSPSVASIPDAAPQATPASDDVTQRLAEIDAQFQAAYERDVAPSHNAAVLDLDTKYLAALQRDLDVATKAGRLEETLALRAEVKRITDKEPFPAADEPKLPASLLKLRSTYRETIAKLEEARNERSSPYHSRRDTLLAEYQSELTRLGRLDDAQRVSAIREDLARRFGVTQSSSPSPSPPAVSPAPTTSFDLPRPDGKPAKKTPRVKVFILMGGNMHGLGKVAGNQEDTLEYAVKMEKLYPFLYDESGNWTLRKDVRNVCIAKAPNNYYFPTNEWMSVKDSIGPEHGIGHQLGNAIEEPVMILKSLQGSGSLGWDVLPPGSESFEFTEKDGVIGQNVTWVHPGYKGSPQRWVKGTTPQTIEWYAGKQYDADTAGVKIVLAKPGDYYPDTTRYEVEGFFWWQGEPDIKSAAHSSRYETNLVQLIRQLRKDFNSPDAKFVIATLPGAVKGSTGNSGIVLDGMLAVDGGSGKYPEFKGNVSTVYSHPLAKGGVKTYMNVGLAMGEAMVKLLEGR